MLLERTCRRFLIVESVRVQPPSLLSGAGFAQLCLGLQGRGPCCLFLLLPCAKQQSYLLLPCLGFLKPLCCASPIKYLLWKLFWQPPITCSAKACCYFVCSVAKGFWQVSPVRSSWGWFVWIPNMSRLEEQAFFKMIDFPRLHHVNVLSTRDAPSRYSGALSSTGIYLTVPLRPWTLVLSLRETGCTFKITSHLIAVPQQFSLTVPPNCCCIILVSQMTHSMPAFSWAVLKIF